MKFALTFTLTFTFTSNRRIANRTITNICSRGWLLPGTNKSLREVEKKLCFNEKRQNHTEGFAKMSKTTQ